jgi:hypothetical protein
MASCPNKFDESWQDLVDAYDEDIAYQKFIDNGEKIPVIKNKRVGSFFSDFTTNFAAKSTTDLINEHPEVAKRITDKLAEQFPDFKATLDGLFTEDGKWVKIPAGKKGMHYRNAFVSAVAWANDAYLETPPHEYAHAYLEMFISHPLVQAVIKEYGIEGAVTAMGKYYAGQEISSNFEKKIKDFWRAIKTFFTGPDILYELSDAFYKARMLSNVVESGSRIIRYQEDLTPLQKFDGFVNLEELADSTHETEVMTREEAREHLSEILGLEEVENERQMSRVIQKLIDQHIVTDVIEIGDAKVYRNAGIDMRYLDDLREGLRDEDISQNLYDHLYFNAPLLEENEFFYELTLDLIETMDHKILMDNSIVIGDGKAVSLKDVRQQLEREISATESKRKSMYGKIKWAPMRKLLKWVENHALFYQLNSLFISKYLSGGENTMLSRLFYRSINKAETERLWILKEFNDIFHYNDLNLGDQWSQHLSEGRLDSWHINDYDGIFIKGKIGKDTQEFKLTTSEAVWLYLMANQEESNKSLREKGIYLDGEIEGRDISSRDRIKLSGEQINNVIKFIEGSNELTELTSRLYDAMDNTYTYVNKTYREEYGRELELRENYMPVTSGKRTFKSRQGKSAIEDFKSINMALGEKAPIRIIDTIKAVNRHKLNASAYAAYSIPITNNRKALANLESELEGTQSGVYIKELLGVLKRLEDNSNLYSSQGEGQITKFINEMTSNFAVSVLSHNIPVMLKQTVSFITAKEEIDVKYLKKAGWGVGGFTSVSFKQIIDNLTFSGDKTMLPLEWRVDVNNPVYKEVLEHSKNLTLRFEGLISRELGEAAIAADQRNDYIRLPWKRDGKYVKISKARLMEGIKIFDMVTVMSIWKAAKFEAVEKYGLQEGSAEFYEHVAERTERIVAKTQPTYDQSNRSIASSYQHSIARVLTMFSSATSKVAMLMTDGVITYMNNPTKENKAKLIKRMLSLGVTQAMTITAINMLKYGLLYGFTDDDDDGSVFDDAGKQAAWDMTLNNLSYFHFIGTLSSLTVSQLDSQPWQRTFQHPAELIVQDLSTVLAKTLKGDLDKALLKSVEVLFKTKGLPLQYKVVPKALAKTYILDN